jgi:hypothetical protein
MKILFIIISAVLSLISIMGSVFVPEKPIEAMLFMVMAIQFLAMSRAEDRS